MNEYDSNRIFEITKKINYSSTKNVEEADCYILNTCHIREKATEKVYHDIGRIKKEFRNKTKPIVLIAGCVAQAEGEILLEKEKYIDAVIGPQSYQNINKIILEIESKKIKFNSTNFETVEKFDKLNLIKNSDSNVSSFLTIQEGCDKFCKFCVVPYTRGPEHSRNFSEIITEANQLVENGSSEITLLGQNVNAYKNKNFKLSDLIYSLSEIQGLKRIRYSTSHPRDFTKDLVNAHKNIKKLMPLIHLPVQSGSNSILKKMNRKHTVKEYLEIISELKELDNNIKFSSDFIIAYPGETDSDFKKTMSLMTEVEFINSYSFIFSPRPGTPSSNLKEIDLKIAKNRLMEFQNLANKIRINYKKSLLGKKTLVLFENKTKDQNMYFGRDEYSNSVIVKSDLNLKGKIRIVKINSYNSNTLFGDLYLDENLNEFAA